MDYGITKAANILVTERVTGGGIFVTEVAETAILEQRKDRQIETAALGLKGHLRRSRAYAIERASGGIVCLSGQPHKGHTSAKSRWTGSTQYPLAISEASSSFVSD